MNIYLIPFIAAFIGWLANSSFIKIAFNNFGKHKHAFANKMAGIVANDFLELDSLDDKLVDPEKLTKLKPFIETHIDLFLKVKLLEKMPFLATFIGESTQAKLKEGMMEEIEALLPGIISIYAKSLVGQVNVQNTVIKKIADMPAGSIESMLRSGLARELKMLQFAGIISGFAIGLISVLLTLI